MKLCFATNNLHKIEEVKDVLGGAFELLSLGDIGCLDELPETMDTLEGNALQKARYVWDRYQTPCFADDTGLEVEALAGAPGVHSARYAGNARSAEANTELLLKNLAGVNNRKAQFRTVIALIMHKGEWLFEGIVKGVILKEPRGTGGFGYDPVFRPVGSDRTLAALTLSEKNKISHRALAVNKLTEFLKSM